MNRGATKLSTAIPALVSGQSAVNVVSATSKCSMTIILCYDSDSYIKGKRHCLIYTLSRYGTGTPIC